MATAPKDAKMPDEWNPLLLKLSCGVDLTDEDHDQLRKVSASRRKVRAGEDIAREGDRPQDVHLVIDGMACRYKQSDKGERSIMALMVPGDICDLHVALLDQMDHSIAALCESTLVEIPRKAILELTDNPRIARAFWWANLVDEATLREWLLNMGHRDPGRRIAHLACELYDRLAVVGLASEDGFVLPLSQSQLGDLFGITPVHINRTIQRLKAENLLHIARRRLTIPDLERLRQYAGYDPSYLHLGRRPAHNPNKP